MTTTFHGVLEGFYGPPYADDARLALVRWLPTVGGRDYVYAPKDDPYQRAQWREPYPADRLAHFAELLAEADRCGVRVGFVVSPGLDWHDGDEAALVAKLQAFYDLGVDSLGVAFDDVPPRRRRARRGARRGRRGRGGRAARRRAVVDLPGRLRDRPRDVVPARVRRRAARRRRRLLDRAGDRQPDDHGGRRRDAVGGARPTGWCWPTTCRSNDGPMAGVLHLGPYPARDRPTAGATGGLLLNLMPLPPVASRVGVAAGSALVARPHRRPRGGSGRPWSPACRASSRSPGRAARGSPTRRRTPSCGSGRSRRSTATPGSRSGSPRGCRSGLPDEWRPSSSRGSTAWEWKAFGRRLSCCDACARQDGPGEGVRRRRGVPPAAACRSSSCSASADAVYPRHLREGDRELADASGRGRGRHAASTSCAVRALDRF